MSLLALDPIEAPACEAHACLSAMQPHDLEDDPETAPRPAQTCVSEEKRWALILAGGDSARLRSLTELISGDDRPKQFCPIFGQHSLLEQTRQRAARSVRPQQTIVALTQSHERFYEQDPGPAASLRLIQPSNRGTAPPIILSLQHIVAQDPDALVAILPSDHYYSDEAAFNTSLESAFAAARTHRESIVLLGAQAHSPAMEYGWIDVGPAAGLNLFRVRGFEEKPPRPLAERLFSFGALWNTFVMVGHASAFLWMSFVTVPGLVAVLDLSLPQCDEHGDLVVPASTYETIPTTDFARDVLTFNTRHMLALRLQDLEWYDLGRPDRVVSVVRSWGKELPAWIHAWEGTQRTARRPLYQS